MQEFLRQTPLDNRPGIRAAPLMTGNIVYSSAVLTTLFVNPAKTPSAVSLCVDSQQEISSENSYGISRIRGSVRAPVRKIKTSVWIGLAVAALRDTTLSIVAET